MNEARDLIRTGAWKMKLKIPVAYKRFEGHLACLRCPTVNTKTRAFRWISYIAACLALGACDDSSSVAAGPTVVFQLRHEWARRDRDELDVIVWRDADGELVRSLRRVGPGAVGLELPTKDEYFVSSQVSSPHLRSGDPLVRLVGEAKLSADGPRSVDVDLKPSDRWYEVGEFRGGIEFVRAQSAEHVLVVILIGSGREAEDVLVMAEDMFQVRQEDLPPGKYEVEIRRGEEDVRHFDVQIRKGAALYVRV